MTKQTRARYDEMLSRRTKTWTKSNIDSLKKLLNGRRFADDTRKQDIDSIYERFNVKLDKIEAFNITKEHSDRGLNYWKELLFKRNGECRNLKEFPLTERQVKIVRNFKKFTFIGFHEVSNDYGNCWYYEIFRVHAKNGEHFDYCPIHWAMPMILKEDGHGYYYVQKKAAPVKISAPDELFNVPRLEEDEISGKYTEVETLFCDSSGWGRSGEAALTPDQAKAKVTELINEHGTLYGAITNSGQFQVYVSLYTKGA